MWFRTVIIYGAIVLGTIAAAEILARVYDWSPRARDLTVGDGLGQHRYYHSTGGFGDLVPNQDGHWVIWHHRPYHVQTNSSGLRNVEEAKKGAFRILAVGDSQTFGPYLANEDTWPAWTEYYLRQRAGASNGVQVFNAGIAGYTIIDELAYLREKGVAFKPSLVVLGVFENDLNDLRKEKDGTVQRPANPVSSRIGNALKAVGRSSALVGLAESMKSQFQLAAAGVDTRRADVGAASVDPLKPEVLAARYRELFGELVALLKMNGIPLAVVFIPSAGEIQSVGKSQMETLIRDLTREHGVSYLNATLPMRAVEDPDVRFFLLQRGNAKERAWVGNGHLSREGNAVIGRAVAGFLAEQSLVPR